MNLPTASLPRFGASLSTNYAWNLPNKMLDTAIALNDAKTSVEGRIKAIDDKKDPIRMDLSIGTDSYELKYETNYNGRGSFKPEANETPAAFIERAVSSAEVLAPKLLTLEEKNKTSLQRADAYLSNILKALMANQVQFVSSRDNTSSSMSMHGTTSREAVIQANGQTYFVNREIRHGNQYTYSIGTDRHDFSKPNAYTSFTVQWTNQNYSQVKMHTPEVAEIDFINMGTHQDVVLKLAQRGKQLFTELENKDAFKAADIQPLI